MPTALLLILCRTRRSQHWARAPMIDGHDDAWSASMLAASAAASVWDALFDTSGGDAAVHELHRLKAQLGRLLPERQPTPRDENHAPFVPGAHLFWSRAWDCIFHASSATSAKSLCAILRRTRQMLGWIYRSQRARAERLINAAFQGDVPDPLQILCLRDVLRVCLHGLNLKVIPP